MRDFLYLLVWWVVLLFESSHIFQTEVSLIKTICIFIVTFGIAYFMTYSKNSKDKEKEIKNDKGTN